LSARVRQGIKKLEDFEEDVFNSEYKEDWITLQKEFKQEILAIELATTTLIADTFEKQLSSSEIAFDLLCKFKNVDTRKAIKDELDGKYENVLGRYIEEVEEMDELY